MKQRAIPWITYYRIKRLILFAGLISLSTISCDKKEPEPPLDCGCDSDSTGYVTNMLGSYQGDKNGGGFALFDSTGYNRFISVGLCELDTTLESSSSAFIFNYRVSGVLKERCPLFPGSSPSYIPGYTLTNPVIVKLKTPYHL